MQLATSQFYNASVLHSQTILTTNRGSSKSLRYCHRVGLVYRPSITYNVSQVRSHPGMQPDLSDVRRWEYGPRFNIQVRKWLTHNACAQPLISASITEKERAVPTAADFLTIARYKLIRIVALTIFGCCSVLIVPTVAFFLWTANTSLLIYL